MGRRKKLTGECVQMNVTFPIEHMRRATDLARSVNGTVADVVRQAVHEYLDRLSPTQETAIEIRTHSKPISGESMATIVPRILPKKARPPVTQDETVEEYRKRYSKWLTDGVGPTPVYRTRAADGTIKETVGPLVSDFSPENPVRAATKKILDEALGMALNVRCGVCRGPVYLTPSGYVCDTCGGGTAEEGTPK
jgi:hypothetical protein